MANQWPDQYVDYYATFIKRLELTGDLCRGAVDEIRNKEYVKKSVMFLKMNAAQLEIEVMELEPLRRLEAAERTRAALAAGEDIKRSKRAPYWITGLVGYSNTSKSQAGLIRKLSQRIMEMFSDKNLSTMLDTNVSMEMALLIVLNDTNAILKIFAEAPRPLVIPPVADRLITRIERFLGEVDRPPSEPTPEARDRKKKFPAKKPKHATKINKPRKAEAVSTKNGGE